MRHPNKSINIVYNTTYHIPHTHFIRNMVCFQEYSFNFSRKDSQYWLPMLMKYHPGIGFEAFINDDASNTMKFKFTPESIEEMKNQLMSKMTSNEDKIHMQTDRCWSEYSCIHALPPHNVCNAPVVENATPEGVKRAAKVIADRINLRVGYGGCDIGLSSSKFSAEEDGDKIDWATLSAALDVVTLSDEKDGKSSKITRMWKSDEDKVAVIVVDDRHTFIASVGGVGDYMLPVFDMDDGFVSMWGFTIPSWDTKFQSWHQRFVETSGASWNDSVL